MDSCAGSFAAAFSKQIVMASVERDNDRDDPVAANKLNIKTDVRCDLGPSHCYLAICFGDNLDVSTVITLPSSR